MPAPEWTVITLKEHFEKLRDDDKAAVAAALAAAQLGIDIAERNAEKWRDNSNEWRDAMNDREIRFVNRLENDALLKAITDRLVLSERWQSKAAGVAAVLVVVAGLIGAAVMKAFGG